MNISIKLAVIGLVLILAACASHKYTVIEPADQSLTDFNVLEIAPFSTNLKDPESAELARIFPGRLHKAVLEYREQNPGDRVYDEITLLTDQTDNVLLMESTVISYEEGSRAKRYFIGLGSGKAYCTIQVVFRNKATGEEIARTNFDGELMGGLFGGEADDTVDGVVKAFIDYMQEYMSQS